MFSILMVTVWHFLVFIFSINFDPLFFNEMSLKIDSKRCKLRKKFYENVFKIKKWKDRVPLGIDRFSKKELKSNDVSYLRKFILETYRGEFNHFLCCLIIFVLLFLGFKLSLFLNLLVIMINIPCVFIQRYNRARLKLLVFNIESIKKIKVCNEQNF
ncbi:MAG: glycosyl-4,4'-diaponeurosporenoate acyltransferase [Candidatus Improbicoccus pseudotrichonymphae]|uniref:Glycosyl-4,4'-diaponeurosporenoate acyltransferase n=1 Tax=Candidatus Improbicoccus pseudotrichonymphae TaxID=3033792 RepID=A0AA48IGQ1_9FIRM|nr:MAG: glycosyl-4,4'-diaponeurosporenoate acyltransferase [Candidatus Improbicoccus pseudotrichonymphae]